MFLFSLLFDSLRIKQDNTTLYYFYYSVPSRPSATNDEPTIPHTRSNFRELAASLRNQK